MNEGFFILISIALLIFFTQFLGHTEKKIVDKIGLLEVEVQKLSDQLKEKRLCK